MAPEELIPPKEFHHLGGGSNEATFKAVGERWRKMLTNSSEGLKPDERVLDAGCGIGRIALPLTEYLDEGGSYEGFDIAPKGIAWCRENITLRCPNFHFQVADIYNKSYNPQGSRKADEYEFPYEDNSFDFAFLASVFTHLLPSDIENYMAQLGRVVRSGGRLVISHFLINGDSRDAIENDRVTKGPTFPHDYGEYRVQNNKIPEVAIAYDEAVIRNLYNNHGFKIVKPISYGAWAGREGRQFRQDIVWAAKK